MLIKSIDGRQKNRHLRRAEMPRKFDQSHLQFPSLPVQRPWISFWAGEGPRARVRMEAFLKAGVGGLPLHVDGQVGRMQPQVM